MICPNCHSENRDGAKFCNECGMPLAQAAGKTIALPEVAPVEQPDPEEEDPSPLEGGKRASSLEEELACEGAGELEDFTCVDDDALDEQGDELPGEEEDATREDAEADKAAPEGGRFPSGRIHALDPSLVPEIDLHEASPDHSGDKTQVIRIDSAKTADLSGLERLVDSSYVPPSPNWRSGDTMELPRIEGEPPRTQKEFKAPDPNAEKKRLRKKHVLVALAALAVAAAVALGATYYLELWGGKTVPDVSGEAQTDAVWVLESKGFRVDTTQVKSDEVEGIVLITDPQAGSRVEAGTTIKVSVATPRAVPDLIGKTQDEAKAALDKEGLENVSFTTEKSNETEGTVIALSLESGTKVKAATALTVTIAEAYTVPDVVGTSQDDAASALEEAGYQVKVATTYDESAEEGTVLSTDPVASSKLNSGSTVTINVAKSRASELVALTKSYFSKGATVVIGGVNCEIVSCDAVDFEGDNTVSYTVTVKKFETTSLFGTLFAAPEQLSGTITWGSDNSIRSANPKLSK